MRTLVNQYSAQVLGVTLAGLLSVEVSLGFDITIRKDIQVVAPNLHASGYRAADRVGLYGMRNKLTGTSVLLQHAEEGAPHQFEVYIEGEDTDLGNLLADIIEAGWPRVA